MRVVALHGDILLANRLLQFVLAAGGGYALLRRAEIRPVLQSLQLKVFQIALQRLIVERPRDVVVGRNGFVTQQLPQVGERLDLGQFRLLIVGFELQQLQFDLQVVVLADGAFVVTQSR